ncbi:MAG: class I SAM-dependent methyltransferase, partial [Candidatus Eremiobacteraeota bacterium]|nr:class I SAM-dependent methyltransferase [Candidatus Eremiobacteraeota bacterium]
IENFRELKFKFPGENVREHLEDPIYTRLWILFEKILKTRDDVKFYSVLCRNCGFIFTNPRYTMEEMKIKYDAINELGSVKYRMKKNPPSNLSSRARRIYDLVKKYFNKSYDTGPMVLDYGGSYGYNLVPFVEKFDCSILDYERWDLPAGIKYLGEDLDDLKNSDKFDVILLLHTLEHVIEPADFLANLCDHLKDDGIIYVEVPLGCFKEWEIISEPLTHVNFFSEESLYNCFEICKLKVIHLDTSFQWVTHGKMWCLNAIGAKNKYDGPQLARSPLSTGNQMNKINYYLPYLFNLKSLRGIVRRIFKL